MAASRAMEYRPGVLGPTGRPLPAFPDPEPLAVHGPARVVAVCNQKGGVGKTTTTISLGAALAEQGRRVLLVDFDPQGALSVGLGFQPHELDATVYNLLMERGLTTRDVLFKTNVDGMDLLPSNIDLSGAEVQLVHEVGREFAKAGLQRRDHFGDRAAEMQVGYLGNLHYILSGRIRRRRSARRRAQAREPTQALA